MKVATDGLSGCGFELEGKLGVLRAKGFLYVKLLIPQRPAYNHNHLVAILDDSAHLFPFSRFALPPQFLLAVIFIFVASNSYLLKEKIEIINLSLIYLTQFSHINNTTCHQRALVTAP